MNRDEYVSAIKEAFITLGAEAAKKYLVARIPLLAWPFFSPVSNILIRMVLEGAVKNGEAQAFFEYIDMRVGRQGGRFEEAAKKNLEVRKNGTKEEIRAAELELMAAFAAFARLTS